MLDDWPKVAKMFGEIYRKRLMIMWVWKKFSETLSFDVTLALNKCMNLE